MVFTTALAPVSSLLFTLILGGLLIELARVVPGSVMRWWMHTGWALCCLPAFLGSFLFSSGLVAVLSVGLICALMIGSARVLENRFVLVLGLTSVVANLFLHGRHMGYLLFESNVLLLALIGAGIVIGGSVIERHGTVILKLVRTRLLIDTSPTIECGDSHEAPLNVDSTGQGSTNEMRPGDSQDKRFAA